MIASRQTRRDVWIGAACDPSAGSDGGNYRCDRPAGAAPMAGTEVARGLSVDGKGLLGDADLATEIADRRAGLGLLQHGRDLLDGEALLLHGTASWSEGPIEPQNSHSQ